MIFLHFAIESSPNHLQYGAQPRQPHIEDWLGGKSLLFTIAIIIVILTTAIVIVIIIVVLTTAIVIVVMCPRCKLV